MDRSRGGAARTTDVPAPEPRRVLAVGARSAVARRRRRRLPAARPEERELRQHRRRAAALADLDAVVPDRRRGDQPAGRRRPARHRPRDHLRRAALGVAARAGGGRPVRHARRALGRAHVPRRRRLPLPRLLLLRDDRRALRQRPRRPAHGRGAGTDRDLGGRRARGAARHRSLDELVRSRRPQPGDRADSHHRRAAPRVGGVHQAVRRPGAGSDVAARLVDRQHQHRRRLRLHHAAAPARHGDHRAVQRERRVRDAEPPHHLHAAIRPPRRSRPPAPTRSSRGWRRRRSAARSPSATPRR